MFSRSFMLSWMVVGSLACESVGVIGSAVDDGDATTTGRGDESSGGLTSELMPFDASTSGGDETTTEQSTTGKGTTDAETTDATTTGEAEKLDAGSTSTGTDGETETDDVGTKLFDPCCAPNEEPGCTDDLDVQNCVCAIDPYCCDEAWDEACVNAGKQAGCSSCGVDMPFVAGCCTASMAMGCDDAEVQACVCAIDPYCCLQQWDETCVEKVDELGCGSCG